LLGLNSTEEITREHLPGILQSLNEQLSSAIHTLMREEHPNNKQIRALKMLQMASNGVFVS